MLFEEKSRNDDEFKKSSESNYEFLNRSSRKLFANIREYLNEWFSEYPDEHKYELEQRLKDKDDINFMGAFTEIFLYKMLKNLGFDIEIHPEIEECNDHPDFLIKYDGNEIAYFESTTSNKYHLGKTESIHSKKIIEYLNNNLKSKVYLNILFKKMSKQPPSLNKIKDAIQVLINDGDYSRTDIVTDGNWEISVEYIDTNKKQNLTQPIGIESSEPMLIDSKTSILNSLKKKGKKYRKVKLPIIIAINILDGFLFEPDEEDIFAALFGDEILTMNIETRKLIPKRLGNGFWFRNNKSINKSISSVIICSGVNPWNIGSKNITLWHNPYTNDKINPEIFNVDQKIPNESERTMYDKSGKSLVEILELVDLYNDI